MFTYTFVYHTTIKGINIDHTTNVYVQKLEKRILSLWSDVTGEEISLVVGSVYKRVSSISVRLYLSKLYRAVLISLFPGFLLDGGAALDCSL